jgi:hypothetical protein
VFEAFDMMEWTTSAWTITAKNRILTGLNLVLLQGGRRIQVDARGNPQFPGNNHFVQYGEREVYGHRSSTHKLDVVSKDWCHQL